MKKLALFAIVGLMASNSFAATVLSAKLDASKKNILVDVRYGGGCGEHKFSLKVGGCLESYPVQCSAKLVEETKDFCEALIHETVVLPLSQYNLTDGYYSKGSLTIVGDLDWQTQKPSQATVKLP